MKNNLDLIRLLAATQVAVAHGLTYIGDGQGLALKLIAFVPGVPIFFFVSGFLISASFERSTTISSYARKRVLRIYPALWLCIALTVLLLVVTGYVAEQGPRLAEGLVWIAAQVSFFQFYNPEFARHFGAGIVNPALWTICVELQFYLMMPLLSFILRRNKFNYGVVLLTLVAISTLYSLYLDPKFGDSFVVKLMGVTFLPWICMFMFGNLAQKYFEQIRKFAEGRGTLWVIIYLIAALIGLAVQELTGVYISGNRLSIVLFLPLAMLVLSIAYTRTQAAQVLRGHDISYGLYLFHMPVIGAWLYLSLPRGGFAIAACLAVSVLVATFSWITVERRALRLGRGLVKS